MGRVEGIRCAHISLSAERHGEWHTPPHWIDSLFQLAGFVMNGSDATSTRDYFYITPGWTDLRWVGTFEAGVPYRSYVRMAQNGQDPTLFVGDWETCETKFRRMPRVLLGSLFQAHERDNNRPSAAFLVSSAKRVETQSLHPSTATTISTRETLPPLSTPQDSPVIKSDEPSIVIDCLRVIARVTGYPISDLTDDSAFTELGVHSLMSLVLAETFRNEVGLEVKSWVFLECATVKELKLWLDKQFC